MSPLLIVWVKTTASDFVYFTFWPPPLHVIAIRILVSSRHSNNSAGKKSSLPCFFLLLLLLLFFGLPSVNLTRSPPFLSPHFSLPWLLAFTKSLLWLVCSVVESTPVHETQATRMTSWTLKAMRERSLCLRGNHYWVIPTKKEVTIFLEKSTNNFAVYLLLFED